MRRTTTAAAALGIAALMLTAAPAAAQYGMDKKPPKNAATPELPRCAQPLGRAAIQEPDNKWWVQYQLPNPEALIKLFAMRSNCLRIVDRNGGLAMRNQEAEIAASGDMRRGGNIGKGQVAAADFFIVPDLANTNSNSGGNALGAVAGAFGSRLGGFGALAGGISTKKAEAQALITLVDARSTEQLYVAEGVAKKTDLSFGAGGGGWGAGGFGAAAGGGYANTDQGKVISAAYFNAFLDLIRYMQTSAPTGAQVSQASAQAYTVKQAALVMRRSASTTAPQIQSFKAGDIVYPTGQKNGIWWEVDDETGNRGWVTSPGLTPR